MLDPSDRFGEEMPDAEVGSGEVVPSGIKLAIKDSGKEMI
jgi:hypothetical protein